MTFAWTFPIWLCGYWGRRPSELRYLVVVQGAEKLFTLHPVPDGLLTGTTAPDRRCRCNKRNTKDEMIIGAGTLGKPEVARAADCPTCG